MKNQNLFDSIIGAYKEFKQHESRSFESRFKYLEYEKQGYAREATAFKVVQDHVNEYNEERDFKEFLYRRPDLLDTLKNDVLNNIDENDIEINEKETQKNLKKLDETVEKEVTEFFKKHRPDLTIKV